MINYFAVSCLPYVYEFMFTFIYQVFRRIIICAEADYPSRSFVDCLVFFENKYYLCTAKHVSRLLDIMRPNLKKKTISI